MGRKRILIYIFVGSIVLIACLLVVLIVRTHQQKKDTEARVQRLQHCCFPSLHGNQVCIDEFDPNQATVIVFFHPECEHCQYEAKEMGIHASQLRTANVLMITPDQSVRRLTDFATENHLWELDNFEILLDSNNTFETHFGTTVIPSVFIYRNGSLIKKYIGETKIEAILSVLDTPSE